MKTTFAAKQLKISHNNIWSCCTNRTEYASGYKWKYKNL